MLDSDYIEFALLARGVGVVDHDLAADDIAEVAADKTFANVARHGKSLWRATGWAGYGDERRCTDGARKRAWINDAHRGRCIILRVDLGDHAVTLEYDDAAVEVHPPALVQIAAAADDRPAVQA